MRCFSGAVVSVVLLAVFGMLHVDDVKGAEQRRFINMPGRSDNNPYSNAVLVGDTLYLAGEIGIDPATGAPPPKIADEVRLVMESMKARLEMAGMSMEDLVTVEVHCSDIALYDQFNDVYRTYFNDRFPARAFLGSGKLLLGGHFEVTGVAVRRN
jgi:2-iminobutanoate/2-iminopropanoate deaminase